MVGTCRWGLRLALVLAVVAGALPAGAEEKARAPGPFQVRGEIALKSLESLGDLHLTKWSDALQALARSPEAQSADWERIRVPLGNLGASNVDALLWFALPDGTYWSVQKGKAAGNLSGRDYFPALLARKNVIGSLVVSKATGKSSAIVAVPIVGADRRVVGILGASVFLDRLSEQLKAEMGLGPNEIFYSFDRTPTVGLNWDPALILTDPMKLGPDVAKAFGEMLRNERGTVRYTFRNRVRTVIYERSPITGWWYAFGVLE